MKKIVFCLMLCFVFLVSGCTFVPVTDQTSLSSTEDSATINQEPDIVAGYLLVIAYLLVDVSEIVEQDQYLAIDTTQMINLSGDDQARLLSALESYTLQVMNKSYAQLEQEGYIEKKHFENGILIEIVDTKISANAIRMKASRYRGPLQAFGIDEFSIRYVADHWEITDIYETWVA